MLYSWVELRFSITSLAGRMNCYVELWKYNANRLARSIPSGECLIPIDYSLNNICLKTIVVSKSNPNHAHCRVTGPRFTHLGHVFQIPSPYYKYYPLINHQPSELSLYFQNRDSICAAGHIIIIYEKLFRIGYCLIIVWAMQRILHKS